MARPGRKSVIGGKNVTVYIQGDTATKMDELREVNWSQVCKAAIESYIDARKSVNPEARLKLDQMKQAERKDGYVLGAQLASDILDKLTYDEIHKLRWDALDDESGDWWFDDPPTLVTDWLSDETDGIKGLPQDSLVRRKWQKKFDEWASQKSSLGWILQMAEKKKGLRKNYQFFQGMIAGLRETLQ